MSLTLALHNGANWLHVKNPEVKNEVKISNNSFSHASFWIDWNEQ